MSLEQATFDALGAYDEWHAEVAGEIGDARLNAYFAAIATLGHARQAYPIDPQKLVTSNSQVSKIGSFVDQAMNRHAETRRLPSEKGRTTRSTTPRALSLAKRLNDLESLKSLEEDERESIFLELETQVVRAIRRFLDQQAITVPIDLRLPGSSIVAAILDRAGMLGHGGPVAQHLVGAKLAIRFPEQLIDVHSFTTADQQTGRRGDFQIGPSVFHVTVSEQPGHFQKCSENLEQGLKPYLLVPERRLAGAQTDFEEAGLKGRGALYSIESFVGQNVDELGGFQAAGLRTSFAALLTEYNRRIEVAETNRGLLIQIPDNLLD